MILLAIVHAVCVGDTPACCVCSACSVGDSEAQQAQLSAVTKEATAKALLITIKKLQARCAALRCAVLYLHGCTLGQTHLTAIMLGWHAMRTSAM